MTRVLRVDSSARIEGSNSRQLGDYFQQRWLEANPEDEFVLRDLVKQPVMQIQESTITGFYTPEEELTEPLKLATVLSDTLIKEIQTSDVLLITVPMYNFGIPAALKAWVDQVVRIGHTFSFDGEAFQGLVKANRAVVISAYGASGYLADGPFAAANFLQLYLDFLLGFLGIETIEHISIEATTADENQVAVAYEQALVDTNQLISKLNKAKF